MALKSYKEFLADLKVGDPVNAHYDGKGGRGCHGVVTQKHNDTITVRFIAWASKPPREVEICFENGEGHDDHKDSLMRLLGCSAEGDYYCLGPVGKGE